MIPHHCHKRAWSRQAWQWALGGVLGVWMAMVSAAAPPAAVPAAQPDCRNAQPVPWRRVAPGIWVWPAAEEGDVSFANAGHVLPTSLVVSRGEALVIDPGPTHRHGVRVRDSVACRFKARVRWVVNTHAHAENVMANAAFAHLLAKSGQGIAASAATLGAMQQRCPQCLAALRERIGDDAMAGTQTVLPNRTLVVGEHLRVGALNLRVQAIAAGHTEGDLVLWNARHRVLWAGGLVYGERVPELAQGSLEGWLQALPRLQALRPRHVLGAVWSQSPGALQPPPALITTHAYLHALRARVLQAMDEGRQPFDTAWGEMPDYKSWAGYSERHPFNLQRAWRELEPGWMDRGAAPRK